MHGYFSPFANQLNATGRSRRQRAELHEMQAIARVFIQSGVEGVDPRCARSGLLKAVMIHLRAGADAHLNRAVDEVRIAARADVPLDESDARVRLDIQLKARM